MAHALLTPQALKWTLRVFALLFVVIAALVAALATVDANHFRGRVARFIAARTGREIRIDKALHAHLLSLHPRVIAEDVIIGNPPWMPPGRTAEVGRLSLAFQLLPLLKGSFVIDRLETQAATLHLQRLFDGRANWQAHDPREGPGSGPPLIHSLSIPQTHVEFDDERRHLKFNGTLSAQDMPATAGKPPLRIDGAGDLNGHATIFMVAADSLATVKRGQAYHFEFDERSSGSHLKGRGFLPRPFDFGALNTSFESEGEDLKDLYFLTGVKLLDTGPYQLSGKLAREGLHFDFTDLRGFSGRSDVQGMLSVDATRARPALVVNLHSQLLRLADLGPRAAGRARPSPLLLPQTALPLTGIRGSESQVNFRANTMHVGPLTLHALVAHATIDHGVVELDSLSAKVRDGHLNGRMKFDASGTVPKANLDLKVSDLRLDQFGRKDKDKVDKDKVDKDKVDKDKDNGEPPFEGMLQARLTVSGRGNSLHELGSKANGALSAVLPHGAIRASFAELTGIDVSRALGLMLRKDHKEMAVHCGVASFEIHDGTLSEQSLLVDTDSVLISGKGTVHLDSESLDFAIRGRPKSWRLVRLRSPVLLRGTLAHPSVGIDARDSAVQAGEAVALGVLLTPFAAVLAFVDPGLAKDADCASLLAAAKSDVSRGGGAAQPR